MLRPTLLLASLFAAAPLPGSVAEVEAFRGAATVVRGGRELSLTEAGMPLLATDRVRVPAGGAVPVPFDVQEWANVAMQGRPTHTWERLEVPL